MSNLTACNHCTLEGIKYRASNSGKEVKVEPNIKNGGVDVLVRNIGELKWDKEKHFVVWLMELTPYCYCD